MQLVDRRKERDALDEERLARERKRDEKRNRKSQQRGANNEKFDEEG